MDDDFPHQDPDDVSDEIRRRRAFELALAVRGVRPDSIHSRYGWPDEHGVQPVVLTFDVDTPAGPARCARVVSDDDVLLS